MTSFCNLTTIASTKPIQTAQVFCMDNFRGQSWQLVGVGLNIAAARFSYFSYNGFHYFPDIWHVIGPEFPHGCAHSVSTFKSRKEKNIFRIVILKKKKKKPFNMAYSPELKLNRSRLRKLTCWHNQSTEHKELWACLQLAASWTWAVTQWHTTKPVASLTQGRYKQRRWNEGLL